MTIISIEATGGRGLNGNEKQLGAVDLHAGARKSSVADQALIHAAELEAAKQAQQRDQQERGRGLSV